MSDDNQTPETDTKPQEEKTSKRQMSFVVLEDGTIQANFGEGIEPLTFNTAEAPQETQLAAVTEGFISRARGYTGPLQGDERTPEKLRERIALAFENFRKGVWKTERGEGSGVSIFTLEVEAAWLFRKMRAESNGQEFTETMVDTAEAWNALTEDQRKTVKELPRYQQARAEVQARRNAEKAAKLAKKATEAEANSPF